MLALQRSAGNRAVTRALLRSDRDGDGVEDEPSADAWPRDAAGRLTDEALRLLEERVVAATRAGRHGERGVLRSTGSLESVRGWTDARMNRALRLLADLDHGTDTTARGRRTRGRRGAFDRPILAWESHLDDLGTPDRDTPEAQALEYQNILEFVDRLDQFSRSSMGMDYNPEFDPGAMDAMPRVRIAGAAVGVHPRALYFAAAAQVGMDEREGRASGRGALRAGRWAAEPVARRRRDRGAARDRADAAPPPRSAAAPSAQHADRRRRRDLRDAPRRTAPRAANPRGPGDRRGHRSRPSRRRAPRARVAGVPRRPRRAHPRPRANGQRRGAAAAAGGWPPCWTGSPAPATTASARSTRTAPSTRWGSPSTSTTAPARAAA